MVSKILNSVFCLKQNLFSGARLFLLTESADWVIKTIGRELAAEFNALRGKDFARLTYAPSFIKNKLLHFTSIGTVAKNNRLAPWHSSNRAFLTWYHVLENDPRRPLVPELNRRLEKVHTACQLTARKLMESGFDESKVVVIPESVDLKIFKPYAPERRAEIKRRLGLPAEKFIIGSFQKDGDGWGEGNNPKLIKGPDVFCAALEKLAKDFPVHALLTGPARGYVKNRLRAAGVTFTHHYLKNYWEVVDYYNALDLYIVSSREEGGPKAVLESLACGAPLVSTRVGLAPDVIVDGQNGLLCAIGDVDDLRKKAAAALGDKQQREALARAGLETVKPYDNALIARRYLEELYQIY